MLLGLGLTLLIPALGLGAMAAWSAVGAYRAAFEARLLDTARALALATDREIGTYLASLTALAASAALDGPDVELAMFEREVRRAGGGLGTSIILLDPVSLRQIINTALPEGTRPAGVSAADFRAVTETGRPLVTNLVIGAVARRPVVGVAVPVERDGAIRFVLAARLPLTRLDSLLETQTSPGKAFDVIVDGSGKVVARSREPERYVGLPAPAWFLDGIAGRSSGFLHGVALEGQEVVVGFARIGSAPGWVIGTAESRDAYTAAWRGPLQMMALGGGLIVGLGAAFAIWLSRRLLRPVTGLVGDARAFASDAGEALAQPMAEPSHVAEFEELRLGIAAANAALRARAIAKRSADERQMLLVREVDHRAKNALAVALSVVRLTPSDVPPEQYAESVEGRVAAMARAHSLLAKEAWGGAALRMVAEDELAPYAGRVRLAGDPAYLTAETVQPMAMVLHELATNAAKHGALSTPEGRVGLSWELAAEDGRLRLAWAEEGGPKVAGPPAKRRFGTRLIAQLAERQLRGETAFDWRESGLRFALTLPAGLASLRPGGAPALEGAHGLAAKDTPVALRRQEPAGAGPARLSPPRVLVVEDETLLSLEVEATLRELGYEVVGPARDLGEALRLAATERDLRAAVLDVNLGGRERSFPVADLLQTRDVPYIFVTGYGSASALEGRDSDSTMVLRKPYARQALADALATMMGDP
ncbi:HWE histidine kinase domain-containing protein [Falsiroseomonas tokyonensis]|uniref:HWE histidine kinase domain-containing protein n=1 Tax=Falsiroseomonas tokyonensis TaxID=430521 RepID=UPI001C2082AC